MCTETHQRQFHITRWARLSDKHNLAVFFGFPGAGQFRFVQANRGAHRTVTSLFTFVAATQHADAQLATRRTFDLLRVAIVQVLVATFRRCATEIRARRCEKFADPIDVDATGNPLHGRSTWTRHIDGFLTRITWAGVTPQLTAMLATAELVITDQFARRTAELRVTASAFALVFTAILPAHTFRVARQFLVTENHSHCGAAATIPTDHLATVTAIGQVTFIGAPVDAAIQQQVTCVFAGHLPVAIGDTQLVEARFTARTFIEERFVDFLTALGALPTVGALHNFTVITTQTVLIDHHRTHTATIIVTRLPTSMNPTHQQLVAQSATRPKPLTAPNCRLSAPTTIARHAIEHLRAGPTWATMAQLRTHVTAIRFQEFATPLATRMRLQPQIEFRIVGFAAIAQIFIRCLFLAIFIATFRTGPMIDIVDQFAQSSQRIRIALGQIQTILLVS